MKKDNQQMMQNGTSDKFSDSEFIRRVREHKHNYASDFGNVVFTPARRLLFDILLDNPDQYRDKEERKQIVDAFIKAIENRAIYEQIGLNIEEQLKGLREKVIPGIQENAALFQSILLKHKDLSDALIRRLNLSLNGIDELCYKLENLESEEYGVAEDFYLREEILKAFRQDNINIGIEGKKRGIQVFTLFGEYADVKAHLPKDVFFTHVIGNIINNFHKHAFKDEEGAKKVPPKTDLVRTPGFWGRLKSCFFGRSIKDSELEVKKEKQVQIEFQKDESNPNRLNIFIRNNGTPFDGDVEKVFDFGVGAGSGIGLYSAKSFLNKYDADIKMVSTPDEEYKVSFIINLPIIST